jgi:amino-acid N-acetyltransferase
MMLMRKAESSDREGLIDFIKEAGLSTDAVHNLSTDYFLMEDVEKKIIASIGIERFGDRGLLRSFIFSTGFSPDKIPAFLQQTLLIAQQNGLSQLFLASHNSNSKALFQAIGFESFEKDHLPEDILLSTHVSSLNNNENIFFMGITL